MTAAFLLKAPVPGQVKTRLAADIGDAAACAAYRQLVDRQLAAIPPAWKVHIFYAPSDAADLFRRWLGQDYTLTPQPDGDLGNRQQAAVQACRPDPVALIGGDCPYLDTTLLQQVESGLESHALSMVPAVDGGYVTLAMQHWHPGLFEGIAWSTDSVATQLVKNAESVKASLIQLNPLEDVDTIKDWQRACAAFPELATRN
jgi:hypothetical protein